jgi:cyclic lactone autoinducer peptide
MMKTLRINLLSKFLFVTAILSKAQAAAWIIHQP